MDPMTGAKQTNQRASRSIDDCESVLASCGSDHEIIGSLRQDVDEIHGGHMFVVWRRTAESGGPGCKITGTAEAIITPKVK